MKNPRFFKIFLPGVNDQYLRIPPAFLKHINRGTNRRASLQSPNGNIWHLGLAEDGNGLLFLDGWNEFARENNLKVGYLLLFTYHGNLKFTVLVFDTSGCAIRGASNAPKNDQVPPQSHSNNIPMGGGQSAGGQTSRSKSTLHSKKWKVKCSKRRVWGPSYRPNQRKAKTDITRRSGSLISQRRSVSEEEKERAFQNAKSLVLENPAVLIILRPSHVYFGFFMVFPYKFMTRYLPQETCKMIVWDPAGRQFVIKFINTGKQMCGLSAGWKLFCIANNLEEDDVCVFELIKEKELQVHIFRVVEKITPSINNVVKKRRRPMGYAPQYDGHVKNKMKYVKRSVSTKADVRKLQLDHEANERAGGEYYPRLTLKFPYFLVRLKISSVDSHGALTVPAVFWRKHLPKSRTQILLQSPDGTLWETTYVFTLCNNISQARLCGGWHAFAKHHNLAEGDFCAFELVDRYKLQAHIFYADK